MGSSSDEESDISDSEINEYKEIPYELLKAGIYKVEGTNGVLRCPFCAGKRKRDYPYNCLLQHAMGVAKGFFNQSAKQKANHLALATFLQTDLANENEHLAPAEHRKADEDVVQLIEGPKRRKSASEKGSSSKLASLETYGRKRAKVKEQSSQPLPIATQGNLQFIEDKHIERYDRLKNKPFLQNRYIDDVVLTVLGLKEEVDMYISVGAWEKFFNIIELTFKNLTLEFMSTFELDPKHAVWDHPNTIRFRLLDRQFDMTLTDFSMYMGLYDRPFVLSPEYKNLLNDMPDAPHTYWHKISTQPCYDATRSKASTLRTVGLRYIHNILAHTISGRKDSTGVVSKKEVFYLWSMVEQKPIHLGLALARFMRHQVEDGHLKVIAIGPYVTRLAKGLGIFDESSEMPDVTMMPVRYTTLRHMGLLVRRENEFGNYYVLKSEHNGSDVDEPGAQRQNDPLPPNRENVHTPVPKYIEATISEIKSKIVWIKDTLKLVCRHFSIVAPSDPSLLQPNAPPCNKTPTNVPQSIEATIKEIKSEIVWIKEMLKLVCGHLSIVAPNDPSPSKPNVATSHNKPRTNVATANPSTPKVDDQAPMVNTSDAQTEEPIGQD